jgi:hypothetical protein
MVRLLSRSFVFVALGLCAHYASASESGFYIGLRVGASEADFKKGPLDAAVAAAHFPIQVEGVSKLDNTASSDELFAGYRFTRHLAVEAGYLNLAAAGYNLLGGNPMRFFSAWRSWETEGITLAAIGMLPLGERFDVHARAGVYFADTKFDQRMVVQTSGSESSEELVLGLGFSYKLYETLSASLDYSRYADVGTQATHESNVDALLLGLAYHF